ncbi:MAM domain-containing protein 2 isoform X2 [Amia ocellicauda]|uniref:MAM domain-containing protein 2 isoform X2 n=1 Tax=Amia ocellicauda TaxID=2972642 RepID=UPI0034643C84
MILWDSPRLILVLAWMCGGLSALGNRNRRNDYEGQTDVDSILTSCDFNDDASPFCDFRQGGGNHSDWIRHRGPTPTNGTSPSGDYPSGESYYIYLKADNVSNSQGARLLSPVLLAPGSDLCVQFWFYKYGLDSQNSLAVLVLQPGGKQESLWEDMGAQSHSWLASAVTVPTIPGQQVTVVFEAMRGMSASCDTALDNITISSGACPTSPSTTTKPTTASTVSTAKPSSTTTSKPPASPSTTTKPTTASTVSIAKPSSTTTSKPPAETTVILIGVLVPLAVIKLA